MQSYREIKLGEKGAWISIAVYITLSFIKLSVGYLANSDALLADGYNNTTDIFASLAVLIGLRISRKPPDRDHPYGHFRAETIAALIASFIMVSVGVQVIYKAVQSQMKHELVVPDLMAAWIALGCAIVMYTVYRYNLRLAKAIDNQAVMAAAKDNRSDALVSLGVSLGIAGSHLGLPWLDPLAALLVGFIICKTAWDIFWEASHTLSDGFDEKRLIKFRQTIAKTPGVREIKDIKARKHGNIILVDVVIQVDPYLNVVESHNITEMIESRMSKEHRIDHVHVHTEPAE